MTSAGRAARTDEADRLCRSAFAVAAKNAGLTAGDDACRGVALVAVGGYGRSELAPCSDLDVVLVHEASVEVGELAQSLWYPLWDARITLDHAVRALPEVTDAAAADVRVAVGLLDVRHLAGDTAVTLQLRSDVLARWRRDARRNLPRLKELVVERHRRVGELAHAAVPDLKESTGGLRDATVLRALVASWLVEVPQADLERSRRQLLDVRDVLQEHAGRATDRIAPEHWAALAAGLGMADEQEAQRRVRQLGRRVTHLTRVTWSRVDRLLVPAPGQDRRGPDRRSPDRRSPDRRGPRGRGPQLERVAPGLAVADGEVVLDRGADPAADPTLLLRAAASAAERGLVLAPTSAARLGRTSAPMPEPWPAAARDALVRLLAAGPGLLPVWETLEETGAVDRVLPEWQRISLLPHATPVHRFTVDRHVVETCVEASRLIRRVARPDLLLVGALLHDIGKGGLLDHSVAGEPLARAAAHRMGFPAAEAATVASMVRHHLLLATTATSRDLADPATIDAVVDRVTDPHLLDLLAVLTEADARATSPQAWSGWRAGLIADLVARVQARLTQVGAAGPPLDEPDPEVAAGAHDDPNFLEVTVEPGTAGSTVRVTTQDRVGLMADVAGALALLRLPVRSARAWTVDAVAVSSWEVAEQGVDPAIVTERFLAVAAGTADAAARLTATRRAAGARPLPPSVLVHHGASRDATVVEVRTEDVRGVVFHTCQALAAIDVSVRSAHVTTIGPQALDVFYVQEPGAGALSDERAAAAAHAVRRALERAATLDA